MANTILLDGNAREQDYIAAAALTPGELVEFAATEGEVQAHSTADGNAAPMFVREQWENDGAGIDDDIASGDTVTVLHCESGAKVYAWLADEQNVSQGDALASDGAGALKAVGASASTSQAQRDSIVAYAAEDLDLTGAAGRGRIRVIIA